MPDNLSFGSGATYSPTGKALNPTAVKELANLGVAKYTGYVPPNPATPVPASSLNTSYVAPPAPAVPDSNAFVGSLSDSQKFFQDLYSKQTADYEAAKKERSDLRAILGEGYDKLNTYGDVYKQTESDMGIPQMYTDLNKLNLQIADLTGAYDKEYQRVETKGITSGTPAVFYQGEQAAIQRQKAVEIGSLGVRQAAMVGNLDLANQRLEKVINIQFKPIENKIKQTLDFLNLNYQDMTNAEKRQADTLRTVLDFQEKQLAQQKEDRSNALMSGVNTRFFKYAGNNTVLDTSTGERLTYNQYIAKGGMPDFKGITEINLAEQKQVLDLMKDYGDAGILPSDSLATATAKLNKSRIYQDKVRGPVGTTTDTQDATVNLFSNIVDQALADGASPNDAVLAAVAVADSTGTNIGLKEQNALLTYAKNKQAVNKSTTKTPPVENPTPSPITNKQNNNSNFSGASSNVNSTKGNYITNIPAATLGGIKDIASGISDFFKTW